MDDRSIRLSWVRDILDECKVVANNNDLSMKERLEHLRGLWHSQNELLHGLDHPTMEEFLCDLEALKESSDFVGRMIASLTDDVTFEFRPSEYADRLRSVFCNGRMDWAALGRIAVRTVNEAPVLAVLSGSIESQRQVQLKGERKKRVFTTDKSVAEMREPEGGSNDATVDGDLEARVRFVMESLLRRYERSGRQPVNYAEFVTHPTEFGTTVQNVYYMSFVIRDGLVGADFVDGVPMLEPREDRVQTKCQSMMSIDVKTWQSYVRKFDVTRPAINWSRFNNGVAT